MYPDWLLLLFGFLMGTWFGLFLVAVVAIIDDRKEASAWKRAEDEEEDGRVSDN